MFYLGIDVAKRSHEATLIGEQGRAQTKSFSFANSQQGCETLLAFLESFGAQPSNCLIGMEATGHYFLSLYCYLLEHSFTVHVLNPIQSDAFRRMNLRQTKNDAKDSLVIAQLLRFGEYSCTKLSQEEVLALRNLSRYRLHLVDTCSDWKKRLIGIIDQVFPEYETLFSDIFGVTSKQLLQQYPLPEDMLRVSAKKLSRLLEKNSRGRFSLEKAKQIQHSAATTFGISFAKEAFSFQIRQILSQIHFLETQIRELEEQIAQLLAQSDYSLITSITGIGDVLGGIIVGEIGDISRFEHPAQLVAYAGLDASVKQSGEFVASKNRISKRGSAYLRRALWMAATVASQRDPALSIQYQKLKGRGKHHLTAVGAVARKMCHIIFAVLRNNTPYTPAI